MVNTGAPSKGCLTCRHRRIKVWPNCAMHHIAIDTLQCDEKKPECVNWFDELPFVSIVYVMLTSSQHEIQTDMRWMEG